MSKIVYLLGAGASFGKRIDPEESTTDDVSLIKEGLPIITEINEEIEYLIGVINSMELDDGIYKLRGKKCAVDDLKEELICGFEWMLEESSRHATIDTFAKKLYLKGDNENYARLKFFLSSFFMLEQNLHPYDKRYDTFLANILNKDLALPNNLFLMTWNYDVQLDIAFREYSKIGLSMVCPTETRRFDTNSKVYKINGSANFYGQNYQDTYVLSHNKFRNLLNTILIVLSIATKDGHYLDGITDLLFSWEKYKFDGISDALYDKISDAEVLVVIGYTFPFFNREIDREIMSNMLNLNKIYIQDPKAKKVKISLKSILPAEKYSSLLNDDDLIYDTSNFFLPPEL